MCASSLHPASKPNVPIIGKWRPELLGEQVPAACRVAPAIHRSPSPYGSLVRADPGLLPPPFKALSWMKASANRSEHV